jgi:methyl-accepting chemotaxis protein
MAADAGRQNPVLHSILRHYPWTYLAFTTDLQGNNLGRSDDSPLKYYGDRDYFTQVVKGAQFGNQVLIGKTSGKPALVLSTGIFDPRSRLQGVLAIAMNLTDISDAIAAAKIGETGFAFLVDEKGEIIAHPNPAFTKSRADFSNHPAFLASSGAGAGSTVYIDPKGERVVAGMLKTRHGWTLVAQQDFKEAYAPVQAANHRAFLLLLLTLVAVSLCAFLLSRKLANPIRSLTRATDQLSQGQLDVVITGIQRRDEIGELAQAIDRLGMSIKAAIRRLTKT